MKNERPFRSEKYQYLFHEINFSELSTPESSIEDIWSNDNALWASDITLEKQKVLTLESELLNIIVKDVPYTDLQRKMIDLILEGKTQVEMAKIFNRNQSSITHGIHGPVISYNGKNKKHYGGLANKIIKYCIKSESIRKISLELFNINEGNKYLRIIKSFFDNYNDYICWLNEEIDENIGIKKSLIDKIVNEFVKYFKERRKKLALPDVCTWNIGNFIAKKINYETTGTIVKETFLYKRDLIIKLYYYGSISNVIPISRSKRFKTNRNGRLGCLHTEETKKKMRESHLGIPMTEQAKQKLSINRKGVRISSKRQFKYAYPVMRKDAVHGGPKIQKWIAKPRLGNKNIEIGTYNTPQEAHIVAVNAINEYNKNNS